MLAQHKNKNRAVLTAKPKNKKTLDGKYPSDLWATEKKDLKVTALS